MSLLDGGHSAAVQQLRILESARLSASRSGSAYGGWVFDERQLDLDSIVYSVGLGTDVSFDLMLIQTARCHVHGFDDTPVSNQFLRRKKLPNKFHWHRFLLGARDSNLTMQLPVGHGVSYAAAGTVRSDWGFQRNTSH